MSSQNDCFFHFIKPHSIDTKCEIKKTISYFISNEIKSSKWKKIFHFALYHTTYSRQGHALRRFPGLIVGHLDTGYPAGTWRKNDAVLTSMRRHHVASTSIRRHFGTIWPMSPRMNPIVQALRPLRAYKDECLHKQTNIQMYDRVMGTCIWFRLFFSFNWYEAPTFLCHTWTSLFWVEKEQMPPCNVFSCRVKSTLKG